MPPSPPPTVFPTPAQIGAAIRAARERAGLAQPVVARRARVGIRFLSELENGKPTARLNKTLAVMRAVGVGLIVVSAPGPS